MIMLITRAAYDAGGWQAMFIMRRTGFMATPANKFS